MAENSPFGTPFLTPKILPKKFMWVPFWRPFPGNEAHKLFSGGPKWGVRPLKVCPGIELGLSGISSLMIGFTVEGFLPEEVQNKVCAWGASRSSTNSLHLTFPRATFRESQETRQSTVQEVNRGQSWLSPPLLMAPKHCKISIFSAMIVPEREFLEPH